MDKYLKSKLIQLAIILIVITLPIGFFQPELVNSGISLERNTQIIRGFTGISVVLFAVGWYQLSQKSSHKR